MCDISLHVYSLDAIARDAELSEQSEADLKRLGQQLYHKLHEMASAKADNNQVGAWYFSRRFSDLLLIPFSNRTNFEK